MNEQDIFMLDFMLYCLYAKLVWCRIPQYVGNNDSIAYWHPDLTQFDLVLYQRGS
jgi:hypothetical protein